MGGEKFTRRRRNSRFGVKKENIYGLGHRALSRSQIERGRVNKIAGDIFLLNSYNEKN